MKCVHFNLLLMPTLFMILLEKLLLENTLTYLLILVQMFVIYLNQCLTLIQIRDLTSTKFYDIPLLRKEFIGYLMKTNSKMNFLIQFYIIRMFLMNLRICKIKKS
jgi:hypothetical protein